MEHCQIVEHAKGAEGGADKVTRENTDGVDEVGIKCRRTRFSYDSQWARFGYSGAEEGHKSHLQGARRQFRAGHLRADRSISGNKSHTITRSKLSITNSRENSTCYFILQVLQ